MVPLPPSLARAPVARATRAAWLDLVLGSSCAGCGALGPPVCEPCLTVLPEPTPTAPRPTPEGFPRCWSSGEYVGLLAEAVVAHKERGRTAVAPFLGDRLAASVAALLVAGQRVGPRPVVLVPVPSSPGAARARGDDPLARVVRLAARRLRRDGHDVRVHPLLRSRGGVLDQGGLTAARRADNLVGSMHCPSPRLVPVARLTRSGPAPVIVLCDDVVTTGATLVEARRALLSVGAPPVGAAVVAAVPRRVPTRRVGAGRTPRTPV
ncbi:ComF family protein [Nocardioides jishulii]|uniref:ComF family protein n=1 Tax=Nocardioides jishulii TaxID=2575440 RepID=A0A4U2YKB7_9ACTN|nr:phosphoribosyltransferase family protein [Nocardioides jishulii]QCX28198.1 ComF family protein [Nocardioides jishulii]TKI60862.1 ComF family protein [Nocardioides jishulii]